jgi:hypothetical protein
MKPDLPRPLAQALQAVRIAIAGADRAAAGCAARELGFLLSLVETTPVMESAAARVLAACADIDDEIEAVSRCRVPPAHSIENAQTLAQWALQDFALTLPGAGPSREAFRLGVAWAFRCDPPVARDDSRLHGA